MESSRAVCIALLAIAELGGGCSGKKSQPPPDREAPVAPSSRATGDLDAGAPVPSPADAAPIAAAAPPDPIASLFRRRYTPDESLSERMQRRIRYHLRGKTKAPIALHHITYIPQPDSGGDVFAIYEYSVYEDCVLGHADRKQGREACTSEPVAISDLTPYGVAGPPDTQVQLNSECVTLGVVRARFAPPGPDVPADAGGAVTISSTKLDGLCEVRDYNRLFVADLDGDERLEMYLDVTTAEEKLNREPSVRDRPEIVSVGHRFARHLHLFAGDGSDDLALSIELADWEDVKLQPEELVELRDINRDRRLDVIHREPCVYASTRSDERCDGRPREKTEYVYDAQRDAWSRALAEPGSGSGSAKEPASSGSGSAKEPASSGSGGAKEPASSGGGSAKEPASGGAKEPASGSAKEPASGSAAPP